MAISAFKILRMAYLVITGHYGTCRVTAADLPTRRLGTRAPAVKAKSSDRPPT